MYENNLCTKKSYFFRFYKFDKFLLNDPTSENSGSAPEDNFAAKKGITFLLDIRIICVEISTEAMYCYSNARP